ncbi:MAG: FAD-binding oxidoreductase [Acidobacteria bacterium]|nr:MAG: FAD-binding oxidoreductase [Acidobacteriota bacterium]
MTSADIVIVGGGCMGTSAAFHLARLGLTNVILLERESQLGAASTGRNAGGVRHQFSQEANVRLSIESIKVFEDFDAIVGATIDFRQDGYLFLLSEPAHVAAFRAACDMQRRLGVTVEWLTPAEAASRIPGLLTGGVEAATFCARDGICDPDGVTMGFAAAAKRAGVEIRRGAEVTGIEVDARGVAAVRTPQETIHTRVVINAAGAWAGKIGEMAGAPLPIWPLRRHIFIAAPPRHGWGFDARTLVIDFASSFYFHREGANMLFGMGDPSEPPGFDTTVNWPVLEQIAPVAARRLPSLSDASIAKAWAGLYEMTPDAMPVIGPAGVDGLFAIAGFSGHGFQHSPAAGRILADLIAGRDPHFDLTPFRHDRFREATAGEVGVV